MKHQDFNSAQWSQRLRGHINLKTCLALGAVALAGAFIVRLPAQNQASTPTQNCCGNADDQIQSPETVPFISGGETRSPQYSLSSEDGFLVGAPIAASQVGAAGIQLLPKANVSKDVSLVGVLIGPFADQSNKIIRTMVELNNAPGYKLIKGATYQIDVVVQSSKANLYGLTLGSTTKTHAQSNNAPAIPLRVVLSNPAQMIHLNGEIEATALLQADTNWQIATTPQKPQSTPAAKKSVVTEGVAFQGAMRGRFLNLFEKNNSKTRYVFGTFDALDLGDRGLLATNYALFTTFKNTRADAQLFGVALGSKPTENLLRADADTNQSSIYLEGVIRGKNFVQTGLGLGVSRTALSSSDTTLTKAQTKAPFDREKLFAVAPLPRLLDSAKVSVRSNAQVAPQATPTVAATAAPRPAPTAQSTPTPMGNSVSIGGRFFPLQQTHPIRIGNHFQIGQDNATTGSTNAVCDTF